MKKLLSILLLCPLMIRAQDSLKAYNNYDFVPGDTIIFQDDFVSDQAGEFPSHWELGTGQAVMNNMNGVPSMLLTAGNYCIVKPRIKSNNYLAGNFSLEFDTYQAHKAYNVLIFFRDIKGNKMSVSVGPLNVTWNYSNTKTLAGDLPAPIRNDGYYDKWHHVAMAFKDNHLKIYVDQYRVLAVPDCGLNPATMECDGIGNDKNPVVFTNMKIAKGANMYISGQKFMDKKIVTHGINFDVNKYSIRPESMGTLNMIVQLMKDNVDVKFEVGGHTDSDGDDAFNMKLSQQRADAVKSQLTAMGIDASRLSTKGYGETKPISPNSTPEGKANNRRVEFVKK